jgi:hypothetical protein
MTLLVTFMTYDVEPSPSSDKQQTELAIPNCHRFSRLPLHIHDIQGQTVVSQKTLSRFCWPVRSHSWLRYPDMIWLILIGCMWCNRRANTEICIIWYHMYIYLMLFVYIYVDICRICIICTIFVYAIYVHMRMILFNTLIYTVASSIHLNLRGPLRTTLLQRLRAKLVSLGWGNGVLRCLAGYSNREEVPAQHSVLPCMIVSLQFA